jgi:anaerobic selenocysteine-containing dehydrogenase
MATETKKTYCRLCTASCAIDVDVEDGSFEEIPTSQALDEIAERLTAIREKYRPRAMSAVPVVISPG